MLLDCGLRGIASARLKVGWKQGLCPPGGGWVLQAGALLEVCEQGDGMV